MSLGRAVRGGEPPGGPPLRPAARGPGPRLAAGGAAGLGRPHPAGGDARAAAATGCSARPSTTPPARPTTRWRATSGLGYPGGPAIDRDGRPRATRRPSPSPGRWPTTGYDFSFSGLKTAVVRTVERHPEAATEDVAASFQEAVVDVLVAKTRPGGRGDGGQAASAWPAGWPPTRCCAGGSPRRARRWASRPTCPRRAMCTDNAAMVAAAGAWRLAHDGPSPLSLAADPNLFLPLTG